MRRFILKSLFSVLLALAALAALWAVLLIPRDEICRTDASMLVCGNSTVEFGVDDRVMPRTLNIGLNAEHLEYIYAKVKLLKDINPGIDTVMIAVDDILLQKDVSKAYSSDLHHFYYIDQFTPADLAETAGVTSCDWMSQYFARPLKPVQMVTVLGHMAGGGKRFADLGVGGYMTLETDNLQADIDKHGGIPEVTVAGVPELSRLYLDKIRDYCRERGMTLLFFTTPRHPLARKHAYRAFLREHYPEVPLYDFTDYDLPDSLYSDCTHLNSRGARLFGTILADTLHRR